MSNSYCGLLPLPANFDTDAHMVCPNDIPAPSHSALDNKNAENMKIEKSNKISLTYMRAYAIARAAGTVGNLDVSTKLLPYLEYLADDKALLVSSPQVVAATGPLPIFMTLWIASEQLKKSTMDAAEKTKREKEREAREAEKMKALRPLKGTLLIPNPHPISSTISGPAHIPEVYHTSLAHKIYFPLHWWGDQVLCFVTDHPHMLPCDPLTPTLLNKWNLSGASSAATNRVVNVKKAMVNLGDEDIGLFSPGIWRQSALNMLESFVHLCPCVDPTDSGPDHVKVTYATEFEQHIQFFTSMVCFEDAEKLPVWYTVEHRLHYEIFGGGLFDAHLYEARVDNALSTWE
ncbi:hypothetical protein B0H17DRAFT_1217175 [Mycena rosella]|uniref:Uncharacterized protein n=1 Tax=Mycena rosella TaxID=1033263 RepID=A0AAD7C0V0_MYCRO|nr:hypothetical protein B0H17DRAFT_1217175 [Mycena rosella]